MAATERQLLSQEFLELVPAAARNYAESLRLPKGGSVLFITDQQTDDVNVVARRELSKSIAGLVRSEGHQTLSLEFDEETSYEDMFEQTASAMQILEDGNSEEQRTTVVYIGDQWTNRWGMYDSIAVHSTQVREARIGISPQANISDITVMSQITPDRLAGIKEGIDYFEQFFKENPKGTFVIKTEKDGVEGKLVVKYDTSQAPYAHSKGVLDDDNPNPISTDHGTIFNGGNVLGPESYGTPYPFEESQGTFVTKEGIKITVEDGYMITAENWEEAYESLEDKQKQIIDILNERARLQEADQEYEHMKVALSELGLGPFRMVGIDDIPSDCTTLFMEKLGPHAGGGKAPGITAEEDALNDAANRVGFSHTDFVMSPNTTITFISDDEEVKPFYPPQSL
ncbi:hypothetical protein ACFL25_00740 [Patescibacteria group bacterium]